MALVNILKLNEKGVEKMTVTKKFNLTQEEKNAFTTVANVLEGVCENCSECCDCPLTAICQSNTMHELVTRSYALIIKNNSEEIM